MIKITDHVYYILKNSLTVAVETLFVVVVDTMVVTWPSVLITSVVEQFQTPLCLKSILFIIYIYYRYSQLKDEALMKVRSRSDPKAHSSSYLDLEI